MAELLKVKSRIKSIRDLRQITGAIELVAKIKISTVRGQFQKRNKYRAVVESLFSSVQNFSSVPEIEALAPHIICVFFSQKGFCGAFNNRLVKKVVAEVANYAEPTEVWCFGRKSKKWAYAFDFPYKHIHLAEKDYVSEFAPVIEQWHQDWLVGKVRSLSFIHNQFRSILEQRANVIQLFPFAKSKTDSVINEPIFETKPELLFTDLLLNWWRAVFEGVYWESLVCENCARLVSMKSANENADVMLAALKLKFNKMRQATITQELSEVVTSFEVLNSLSNTVVRKEWFQ